MIFVTYFTTISSYFLSLVAVTLTASLRLGYRFPKINLKQLMSNYFWIRHIIYVVLMISRRFAAKSDSEITGIAIFSGVMLFFFQFTRFMFMVGAISNSSLVICVFVCFVYIIGLSNAIFRLSVFLGNSIDSDIKNNIVYTLDNVPELFSGNQTQAPHPGAQTPLPHPSGVSRLGRLGIVAGIIMVPLAMFTCYEMHATRKLAETSTQAAVDSANAARDSANAAIAVAKAEQQRTDLRAVKHGMMSKEWYYKKYPEGTTSPNPINHTNPANTTEDTSYLKRFYEQIKNKR